MNSHLSSRPRIRSGLFEIDFNSGEVYKNGRRVPVQEQPLRVLAMLLERPGEVVTREQLQARLWPADTYVGFDEGLNTGIRKLRICFGDSADNPRFIETLPRRGYRFIAPVVEIPIKPVPEMANASGVRADLGNRETPQEGIAGISGPGSPLFTPFVSKPRHWSRKPVIFGVAAAILILAGIAYRMRSRTSSDSGAQKRVMLAILPFQNLSNDPAQEYFSDGLTEETITDLGQLSPEGLGVIARTSAMAYKHTDKTVSQIGRELNVDYILEGSVRREGGKARVSAQLIRVSDQTHLWAQNYDRDLNNLLQIEDELGRTIAQSVQVNLPPQGQMVLSKMRTLDPEAYDLYLKGRYYWNQRTPAGIKESIGYFQQSAAKDPNFALAYSGLADAYNISNILDVYSPQDSLPQARAAAEKAIQLDPSLAEAHAALGVEKSHYEFDFPGAEREFLKAIELNPNSAYAHFFYSNCYLLPMGRGVEAISENQKAIALDPLSVPINNFLGMTYYYAGDYQGSYQQFQHTIAMDPGFPLAHEYFSILLMVMGRYEEGIKENEKSELLSGSSPEEAAAEAAAMLKAFKTRGEKGVWQRHIDLDMQVVKSGRDILASGVAGDYAMAGEKDKAFEWLEKGYDKREGEQITLLKLEPSYKNLRGDPRFRALVRRMGLPE